MDKNDFMRLALLEAEKAFLDGEVPVGAVIVRDGEVISTGRNRREKGKNALCHAEIEAIDGACRALSGWRLPRCEMYVTLEPCPMCAGAIVQARIPRVVIGCMNPKAGCAGSVLNLLDVQAFNHQAEVKTKVLEEECSLMMKQFFRELRAKQKMKKKSLFSE